MENELTAALRELTDQLKGREEADKEFRQRILEELRTLNRTLAGMMSRNTVGDL